MYKELLNVVSDKTKIKHNELMSKHTSFKIGGPAECFVVAGSESDLIQILKFSKSKNVPTFIIGNGSNLLISDRGINGIVIKLGDEFKQIDNEGTVINVKSACSMNALAQYALEKSLSGLEWAFGIPGTVGGAVFMNAGAYGGNMSDVVVNTTYLDEKFEVCILDKERHDFGYRKSIFKEKNISKIILSTKLELKPGKKQEIWENMQKYVNARIEKQPLNLPSAGSVFKRPDGYFAGKLIEEVGLKGFTIGGAMVSEKHAGFIVNTGNATAKDVKELIKYIQNRVKEKCNVDLETEIVEVGEE